MFEIGVRLGPRGRFDDPALYEGLLQLFEFRGERADVLGVSTDQPIPRAKRLKLPIDRSLDLTPAFQCEVGGFGEGGQTFQRVTDRLDRRARCRRAPHQLDDSPDHLLLDVAADGAPSGAVFEAVATRIRNDL